MNKIEQLLSLSEGKSTLVMGILNVTPDSFSNGGGYRYLDAIQTQVSAYVSAGVDIIDIGGESTRPGAAIVPLQQELDRVMPIIEWVKSEYEVAISVDTYKTDVMIASLALGVDMINDVNALQSDGAQAAVASSDASVCLMHRQGNASNMQKSPSYGDVVSDVERFLLKRANACEDAGISSSRICLDPGFGFGKTFQHNVALFEGLESLVAGDYPMLVGVSRKSMIGEILGGLSVEERGVGSVAAALIAMMKGARIIRVHDVKETVQAFKVVNALTRS